MFVETAQQHHLVDRRNLPRKQFITLSFTGLFLSLLFQFQFYRKKKVINQDNFRTFRTKISFCSLPKHLQCLRMNIWKTKQRVNNGRAGCELPPIQELRVAPEGILGLWNNPTPRPPTPDPRATAPNSLVYPSIAMCSKVTLVYDCHKLKQKQANNNKTIPRNCFPVRTWNSG